MTHFYNHTWLCLPIRISSTSLLNGPVRSPVLPSLELFILSPSFFFLGDMNSRCLLPTVSPACSSRMILLFLVYFWYFLLLPHLGWSENPGVSGSLKVRDAFLSLWKAVLRRTAAPTDTSSAEAQWDASGGRIQQFLLCSARLSGPRLPVTPGDRDLDEEKEVHVALLIISLSCDSLVTLKR